MTLMTIGELARSRALVRLAAAPHGRDIGGRVLKQD
jgi:hypothetical protein